MHVGIWFRLSQHLERWLPRELRIMNAHFRAFAPGATRLSATRVLKHLVITIIEILGRESPTIHTNPDTEHLIAELKSQGVLVLTAHFGNWELLGRYGISRGVPFVAIARALRNSFLQKLLSRFRMGVPVIWKKGSLLGAASEVLASKKWLAALIDQDLHARSERVDGFGLRCSTPSSLVELAIRHGSAIVAVFLPRRSDGSYELFMNRLDASHGIQQVLTEYQQSLQHVVNQYPEQWMWFHKRWRSTPSERIPGKAYVAYLERIIPLGDPFIVVRPVVHSDELQSKRIKASSAS